MDKRQLLALVAAILSTLADTDGSPESMLYLACESDMAAWDTVRHVLVAGGLVTITGHYVRLTDKGRQLAAEVDATVTKRSVGRCDGLDGGSGLSVRVPFRTPIRLPYPVRIFSLIR